MDSAIRVTVTPSQSSYFAGEQFSAVVTFKNTRISEPQNVLSAVTPRQRSTSHTHKRGAHSVSSAPLPRPPTSPGRPRTPIPTTQVPYTGGGQITRKGLVGDDTDAIPQLLTERMKAKASSRSLSVTISPSDLSEVIMAKSATFASRSFQDELQQTPLKSPHSPRVPSSLSRLSTFPLSSNHPHARKQSILDGSPTAQIQIQDTPTKVNGPQSSHPYSIGGGPTSASSSTSASSFSLALDPIAEASSSSATSPLGPPFPDSAVDSPTTPFAYPPRPPPISVTPSGLFSAPSSPTLRRSTPQRSQSANFSDASQSKSSELVLYAYAHLVGTLTLSTYPNTANPNERLLRRMLLGSTGAVGGGSMDITPSLSSNSHRRRTSVQMVQPSALSNGSISSVNAARGQKKSHARSMSFGAGLLSLLSSSTSSKSIPTSVSDPGGSGLRSIASTDTTNIDPETPLPTLETQPVMLVVDLALAPGEERSYTYTLSLPPNLPPTFRGSNFGFSYELIVGTCRSGSVGTNGLSSPTPDAAGSKGTGGISRVMKMPVRVYNNVSVRRKQSPYDLLWPIARRKENVSVDVKSGKVEEVKKREEDPSKRSSLQLTPAQASSSSTTLDDIKDYAKVLLDSGSGLKNGYDPEATGDSHDEDEEESWRGREENAMSGCREAVEILTRISKKVSYDVNKDGVKVAVLTFSKSAYRLGESLLGVVEVNERLSRARVLKLSAFLETQEILPSSLSSATTSPKHTRRVHAEHHSSFLSNSLRTTFVLNIPSDGTPAFGVNVEGTPEPGVHPRLGPGIPPSSSSSSSFPSLTIANSKPGGFEWKVRLCLLVAVAAEDADPGTEGVVMKGMVRDGERGEWGSGWKATSGIAPLEYPPPPLPPKSTTPLPGRSTLSSPGLEDPAGLQQQQRSTSWAAFFTASFLGSSNEREYHDGDDLEDEDGDDSISYDRDVSTSGGDGGYDGIKPNMAGGVGQPVNFGGVKEEGWKEVKMETVECEVPVSVWPGNTAYKALDVVFDV